MNAGLVLKGQIVSFADDDVLHHERGAIVTDASGRIQWIGDASKLPSHHSSFF